MKNEDELIGEIIQNNLKIEVYPTYIKYNGSKVNLPQWVKEKKVKSSSSVINNKVYVNGFYFNPETMQFERKKGTLANVLQFIKRVCGVMV